MFSADLDTRTPMEQAQRLLPYLKNARHVVLRRAGHADLLNLEKPVCDRILAFFEGQPVDLTSIAMSPIDFAPSAAMPTPGLDAPVERLMISGDSQPDRTGVLAGWSADQAGQ